MSESAGTAGLWLLAIAGAALLLELLLLVPSIWALRRRALALRATMEREGALTRSELERLRRLQAETEELLKPYRRLARFLSHPLVLALFASWRRRRAPA